MSVPQLMDFLGDNQAIWIWLMIFSAVAFLATLVIIPWLVLRIPVDYFVGDKPPRAPWVSLHPVLRIIFHVLKNMVGLALIIIGIALLFLPGQGVLTIVFGILLMDFPGRYRMHRWLVERPTVLKSINWLRQKYQRPPLRFHEDG